MSETMQLVAPKIVPPLDPDFRPPVVSNRAFWEEANDVPEKQPLILALERSDGSVSRNAAPPVIPAKKLGKYKASYS